jgi:hypothetical protein
MQDDRPSNPQTKEKKPGPPEPPPPFAPDSELITYLERGQGEDAENR